MKGLMKEDGFTLIEVLAALVIFSIAIVGLTRATTQSVAHTQRLTHKTYASVVADNQLILARMRRPEIGTKSGEEDFALISAGTLSAMFQTFEAKERLDKASSELSDIEAFRAILRADLNAMELRPMRDGVGGLEPYVVTTRNPEDSSAILTFTRLGRSNPAGAPRGQAERVRYSHRDGQFIRETLRHENPSERGNWTSRVLLENVEDVDVAFRARAPFENASPIDISVQDWTITLSQLENLQSIEGAVEFIITDRSNVETSHLFELTL